MQRKGSFFQAIFFLLVVGTLNSSIKACLESNPEAGTKYYHDISCDISSGDYDGSELNDVIEGGTSNIQLTVAAVTNSQDIVTPIVTGLISGLLGSIPNIGAFISSAFSTLIGVLDSSTTGPDPYQALISDLMATVHTEINNVYDYVDENVNAVVYGIHDVELQQILRKVTTCELYNNEDDMIDCLLEAGDECEDGVPYFNTFHDNIVDYEQTFPMMRQYGDVCNLVYAELLSGVLLHNKTGNARVIANQHLYLLRTFIELYEDKLDLIIDKHTSSDYLHSNLYCSLEENFRYYYYISTYGSHSAYDSSGYTATCYEYFGHRSVARNQEKCSVSRTVGCRASINIGQSRLSICNEGTAKCNRANALLYALEKLERYFKTYAGNRATKLNTYWQNSVGDVIDQWKVTVTELETLEAALIASGNWSVSQ